MSNKLKISKSKPKQKSAKTKHKPKKRSYRRNTTAALVDDYNNTNFVAVQRLLEDVDSNFTSVNVPNNEIRLLYILLYDPLSFEKGATIAVEKARELDIIRINNLLVLSNQKNINCGGYKIPAISKKKVDINSSPRRISKSNSSAKSKSSSKKFEAQLSKLDQNKRQVEYCGNCYYTNDPSNYIRLNLGNMITGGVVGDRGICILKEYSNILWHTHPLTSRPWPSGEDIAKIIKSRPDTEFDKIPIVSLIFTKWGIWQIASASDNKINTDDINVRSINRLGLKIFEEKWSKQKDGICQDDFRIVKWRQSITNRVNDYIVTLMTTYDSLNPEKNGGGFVKFTFWDTIAYNNFDYLCHIPNSDAQNILVTN